jgi:hypothetical protein
VVVREVAHLEVEMEKKNRTLKVFLEVDLEVLLEKNKILKVYLMFVLVVDLLDFEMEEDHLEAVKEKKSKILREFLVVL